MKEENRKIIEELPFLQFKVWDPEVEKYVPNEKIDGTQLDCLPAGWRTLAVEMFRKIRDRLIEEGGQDAVDNFMIDQLKEKFGEIRLYAHPTSDEVENIISEYERKSADVCCCCGKRATRVSKGWICPFCDDCHPDWWTADAETLDSDDRYVRIDRSSENGMDDASAAALGYHL